MGEARFERPLLPIPIKEIERLPYAKPGKVRRIFYCPRCGRQMLMRSFSDWAESETRERHSWSMYLAFRELYFQEEYNSFRVATCPSCQVHIGFMYSGWDSRPENIISRFTTEELYDFVEDYEEKSLFD